MRRSSQRLDWSWPRFFDDLHAADPEHLFKLVSLRKARLFAGDLDEDRSSKEAGVQILYFLGVCTICRSDLLPAPSC